MYSREFRRSSDATRVYVAECQMYVAECHLRPNACRMYVAECRLPSDASRMYVAECRLPSDASRMYVPRLSFVLACVSCAARNFFPRSVSKHFRKEETVRFV